MREKASVVFVKISVAKPLLSMGVQDNSYHVANQNDLSCVSIFPSSFMIVSFWQFFNGAFLGLVAKLSIKPSPKLETKTMWT